MITRNLFRLTTIQEPRQRCAKVRVHGRKAMTVSTQTELDGGCQRELHRRLRLAPEAAPDREDPASSATLEQRAALGQRSDGLDPRIVSNVRSSGQSQVHHHVLPFRFEVRAWTRPGELSLIHRTTARVEHRSRDRRAIEQLLAEWSDFQAPQGAAA